MTQVLIIEDDPVSSRVFERTALDLGGEPTTAANYDRGLELATTGSFDLIVIDRMLPGGDGVDAIAKLRLAGSNALILVVSALGRSANKIEGLEKGADDYLAKPFDPEELRARMQSLMRRVTIQTSDNDLIAFGDLEIRRKARTVHFGIDHVPVTPKEFDLLCFFAINADATVTRMQLLENVWNLHFDPQTNVVDVHVGRLRRKLEDASGRSYIQTSRGAGYMFLPQTAVSA